MAKQIVSPKNGFTTTFLNKLKTQDKQFELIDHSSKGLRIRVSPSGTKTFIWRYITKERKSKVYTLGYYVDKYAKGDKKTKNITLSDAREKLLTLKALHKSGNLLTAQEQRQIEEEKRIAENKLKITLGDKIEDFYKTLEATRRRPESARQLIDAEIRGKRKGFEGVVLGDLVLRDVTSQDVQELIYNTIRRGAPEHAMKLLALLKQFFSWCENGDHIVRSPIDKLNRKYFGVISNKEEHIFDIAPEEEGGEPIAGLPEIIDFFETLDKTPRLSIQIKNGLKILLLTGVRTGELLKAQKGAINDNNWFIPKNDTKTLEGWTVPLSDYVLALFKELENNSDCNYYMGSIDSKAMARAVNRLCKKHQWNKFTPHTLRKVFRTHIEFMGVTSRVAEKCLNHSLGKIEGTYNKAKMLEKRREALVQWSAKIERALHPENNVIEFKVS